MEINKSKINQRSGREHMLSSKNSQESGIDISRKSAYGTLPGQIHQSGLNQSAEHTIINEQKAKSRDIHNKMVFGDAPTDNQASQSIKFLPVHNHPTLPSQPSEKSFKSKPKQRGTESMPVFHPVM